MDNYKPVIKGNSIYIYCSLRDKEEYGYSTIKKIEKLFPTINFIYCTNSIFYEKFIFLRSSGDFPSFALLPFI